ncbi:VIT1/CCC1 transporter family protein [Candidatus Giovannonibacteria bacterium]|nr:VIT1/CCC1 transporter family protein [Candidatus Giovannonibacteria bacterium]
MINYEKKFRRLLVLDELFDLTLYRGIKKYAKKETARMLEELIAVEEGHLKFWKDFFNEHSYKSLGLLRRIKLLALISIARIFKEPGIFLILEAIEVYGIQKYLKVWEVYKDDEELKKALENILRDEFKHEDAILSRVSSRKMHPERIRDIFLGFNDGLVEILGAVSGFFAAFHSASSVLVASFMVAVAGAISMGAGAYVALGSSKEVEDVEIRKKTFLGEQIPGGINRTRPFSSSLVVGISYFIGAVVPIIPVIAGAQTLLFPLIGAALIVSAASFVLAFLSGMETRRRIVVNLGILAFAVLFTYFIGIWAKTFWGVTI